MLPFPFNLFLLLFISTKVNAKEFFTIPEAQTVGAVLHHPHKRTEYSCPFVAVCVNVSHKADDQTVEFAKESVKIAHGIEDVQQRCVQVRERMKCKYNQYWQVFEGEDFAYSLNYVHFVSLHACGCDHCYYYILFASHLNVTTTQTDEKLDLGSD